MTNTERQQHWLNIFRQWRDSGLSKSRFCTKHHITLSNFYRWQKILKDDLQACTANNPSTTSAFVPLTADPAPACDLVSLAIGSLRLQIPITHLEQALSQLKNTGLIDA